jgi:hypothetical protein
MSINTKSTVRLRARFRISSGLDRPSNSACIAFICSISSQAEPNQLFRTTIRQTKIPGWGARGRVFVI